MRLYIVVNQFESNFGDVDVYTYAYSTLGQALERIKNLHDEAILDRNDIEDDYFDDEDGFFYRVVFNNDSVDDAEIHEAWLDDICID